MRVRRVVTGFDDKGRSVFLEDEQLDVPELPGIGPILQAWSADEPATYPASCRDPRAGGTFPPVGGVRMLISTLNAGYGTEDEVDYAELAAVDPDTAGSMEKDNPGMHTTDTTDFDLILSGTVIMELDDGAEVHLGPGDLVVQNGTRHRWRNPSAEPITMACFMVGAHRT